MPQTSDWLLEVASLRDAWQVLERAGLELPEDLHIHGLRRLAMGRLDDRIECLERKMSRLSATHWGAAA